MSQMNVKERPSVFTHEGAPGRPPNNPLHELRRAVASCFLWEDTFYESGVEIGERISTLVAQCDPQTVGALAVEARSVMNLRHAPLWLIAALVKNGMGVTAETVTATIQRADEMGELIAMVRGLDKRQSQQKLPNALKRGIALAFGKFDAYQLGKYNRDKGIKLKDVLRIVHPKPETPERAELYKQILDDALASPDTWEVALSGGADKKETFTRLLNEGKLGYLALLRNLRNMDSAGVDHALINQALLARKGAERVLPFRFVSAAKEAPMFVRTLDQALIAQIESLPEYPGKTAVLVDTSGSMDATVSQKSKLKRWEAAAVLGAIIPGNVRLFNFGTDVQELQAYRGLAGVNVVQANAGRMGHGTEIGRAVRYALQRARPDRVIVVTDMQSHDTVADLPAGVKGYMINVAPYRNGVGFGGWTHIDGFSESTLKFISEVEKLG